MGKAKAKSKAKKDRVWCDAGMIPFKHRKLTPERALQWMREEYEGYHDLAVDGQRNATDDKDRDAFHNLAFSVARMVEACRTAIEIGEAVYLEGRLEEERKDGRPEFLAIRGLIRILRFRQIDGAEELVTIQMHNVLEALFHAVQGYVDAATAVELEAERVEICAWSEREAHPEHRLEEIREERKALESERDAALDDVAEEARAAVDKMVDKAAEPWERKLACLKYEEDLIWHKGGGTEHPGKPPESYEPITGAAALAANGGA